MARKQKRSSLLNHPHPTENDKDRKPSYEQQEDHDVENYEEGDAVSSDDQEGDDDQDVQPAPRNPSSSKHRSSSSDSDSDTESDSEPKNPRPSPNYKAKPIPSKHKEAPTLKRSQPSSSAAVQDKSLSKRPDLKHANKKKKVEAEDTPASIQNEDDKTLPIDDSKKMFQRLFSDEDELAILEGMLEFRSAMGGDDPYKCADAFHSFMMKRSKRISFDASSGQLKEKIRRLKTKFNKSAERGKNGEAPRFSKPHEQRVFELSEAIWGQGARGGVNNGALEKAKSVDGKVGTKSTKLKDIINENAEKLKSKAIMDSELQLPPAETKELGKVDERPEKGVGLVSMIGYDKVLAEYGLGEYFLIKADGLMEASKRAEFEGKWKKLEAAESEFRVKRAELYANHAKSLLQAFKSSKN